MSEPEKKLVRSFAGPPGIEDAPRTDATRDLVVETSYPTHGSLRLTMAPAFQFAGCHSLWDNFLNDDGIGDERVDKLPGLYMDDDDGRCETLTGAERLSASMIEAQKQGQETHFPRSLTLTSASIDGQTHWRTSCIRISPRQWQHHKSQSCHSQQQHRRSLRPSSW